MDRFKLQPAQEAIHPHLPCKGPGVGGRLEATLHTFSFNHLNNSARTVYIMPSLGSQLKI